MEGKKETSQNSLFDGYIKNYKDIEIGTSKEHEANTGSAFRFRLSENIHFLINHIKEENRAEIFRYNQTVKRHEFFIDDSDYLDRFIELLSSIKPIAWEKHEEKTEVNKPITRDYLSKQKENINIQDLTEEQKENIFKENPEAFLNFLKNNKDDNLIQKLIETLDEKLVKTPDEKVKNNPLNEEGVKSLLNIIKNINSEQLSEENVKSLLNIIDGKVTNAQLEQLIKRDEDVNKFKEMIENNKNEREFQKFFEENNWFLGNALRYDFLVRIQPEKRCKNNNEDGTKERYRIDFTGSKSSGYAVLVEIKTPKAKLIGGKRNRNEKYYPISRGLSKGISQLQYYLNRYPHSEEDKKSDEKKSKVAPIRGILIIGKTPTDEDEKLSFELFRSDLHDIDIITYDELLKRAENIIKEKNESKDATTNSKKLNILAIN